MLLHHSKLTWIVWSAFLLLPCSFEISVNSHDWDILIFTQHWPITVCLHYEDTLTRFHPASSPHSCTKDANRDTWTIHGIWPTKLETEGPAFCNTSIKFNVSTLDPIRGNLVQDWPNIEAGKGTSSLWRHEWLKHGTCAVTLAALNDEVKYFGKGLELFNKFNMTTILASNGIHPSTEDPVHVSDVYSAVQKTTGKNPYISCVRQATTKKAYLFEIRLCFDKNLQLTDCNGIKRIRRNTGMSFQGGEILTNCPLEENLNYPKELPPVIERPHVVWGDQSSYHGFLSNALSVIKFLQWMTL